MTTINPKRVARMGVTAALTASIAFSCAPAMAIAQGVEAAPAAAASQYGWVAGQSYEVGVTWSGTAGTQFAAMDGMVKQMIGKYFGDSVHVVPQQDGTFNVVIGFNEYSAAIEKISYNGQDVAPSAADASATFTFNVASPEEPADIKVFIGGAMAGMFADGVAVTATFDSADFPAKPAVDKAGLTVAIASAKAVAQGEKTDDAFAALQQAIATAQAVADSDAVDQAAVDAAVTALNAAVTTFQNSANAQPQEQELALQVYFKGQKNDRFAGSLGDGKAMVTATDDGYQVKLTAPSLSKAGGTLGDITLGGKKVSKQVNEDSSATYTFTVDSLDKLYDITFGYSINAGNKGTFTNLHPFQVAFGDADVSAQASKVDKTPLTAQIVKAEAALKTISGDAATALQKAIDEAYVKVDTADLTAEQVTAQVEALTKAVDAATAPQVDTSKLTAAIAAAQKAEQGNKTDDAYAALQDAIKAAQTVADNGAADQGAVDQAVTALNAAVEAFKTSADKPADKPFEEGKIYSVPAAFNKTGSSETSMAAGYFAANATVTRTGDTYTVTFSTNLTAEQQGWITDVTIDGAPVQATEDGSNLKLTFTTADITKAFALSMKVQPMDGNAVSLDMKLNVLAAVEGDAPTQQADKSQLTAAIADAQKIEQGKKSDKAWSDLQDAIKAAQAVADNKDASQAQVDAAVTALNGAVEAFNRSAESGTPTTLTTKPTTKPSTSATSATGAKTAATKTAAAAKTSSKLPATGDPASLIGMAATALTGLGFAGAGAALRRRAQKGAADRKAE